MDMKPSLFTTALAAAAALAIGGATQAHAAYSQGFETADNTGNYDWNNGTVTRVQASGSTDPTTASGGSYYGQITNPETGSGYTNTAYTYFGGKSSTYAGPFSQSLDLYVDADWAAPDYSDLGFVLAMAPSDTSGATNYGAVHQFRFYTDGTGSVRVDHVQPTDQGNATTLATITDSGWYTFEVTFSKGATGSDPVESTLNIYNVSTATRIATLDTVGLYNNPQQPDSNLLGGNGIAWINTWRNGFAGDTLALDNVTLAAVPEPASLALLGAGGLLMLKRRRSA